MLKNANYVEENNIIADNSNTKILGKKAQVGFDLSVKNIYDVATAGFVSKSKTFVGKYVLRPVQTLTYEGVEFQGWFLPKGAYILEINEGCKFGPNDTGYIIQRSSLNRNNVGTVSSLWDPGFTTADGDKVNTITIRITVDNENGLYLEKDARVAQLLVFENENSELYGGAGSQFQGGRTTSKLIK